YHVQPFDEPEKLARMHDGQWLETGRLVGGLGSRVVPAPPPPCIDKGGLGGPPRHAFVTPDPRPDPIDRHIPACAEAFGTVVGPLFVQGIDTALAGNGGREEDDRA